MTGLPKHNMLKKEDCLSYGPDATTFLYYAEAVEEYTDTVEEMLGRLTTFEELKAELLLLCQERREFVRYANDHAP